MVTGPDVACGIAIPASKVCQQTAKLLTRPSPESVYWREYVIMKQEQRRRAFPVCQQLPCTIRLTHQPAFSESGHINPDHKTYRSLAPHLLSLLLQATSTDTTPKRRNQMKSLNSEDSNEGGKAESPPPANTVNQSPVPPALANGHPSLERRTGSFPKAPVPAPVFAQDGGTMWWCAYLIVVNEGPGLTDASLSSPCPLPSQCKRCCRVH